MQATCTRRNNGLEWRPFETELSSLIGAVRGRIAPNMAPLVATPDEVNEAGINGRGLVARLLDGRGWLEGVVVELKVNCWW